MKKGLVNDDLRALLDFADGRGVDLADLMTTQRQVQANLSHQPVAPAHQPDIWKRVGVIAALLAYVITMVLWSADTRSVALQAQQDVRTLQAQVNSQNAALQQALQSVAVQQVQLAQIQVDLRDIKVRIEELFRERTK